MKKLFDLMFTLNGRVSRKVFWLYYIPAVLALIAFVTLENSTYSLLNPEFRPIENTILVCLGLFLLAWGIGNIAVSIKRLHDLNRSGALILFHFIPLFGSVGLLVYLGFFPSYRGHSRHGPAP